MSDLDCTKCGACCVEAGRVPVFSTDDVPRWRTRSIRGKKGFEEYEHRAGTRMMARHMGGRCQALRGVVLKSCSCAVYERRPEVCREFLPGTPGAQRRVLAPNERSPTRP